MNSVLVLVVVCFSLVVAQGNVTKPTLEYTCGNNGNISISTANIQGYHTYAVGPKLGTSEVKDLVLENTTNPVNFAECKVPLSSISTLTQNLNLTKCLNPVYLYLMKDVSRQIVGGRNFHEYILSCDFPEKGIEYSVEAGVSPVTYPTPETKEPKFNINLLMTINPTRVEIGDSVKVKITETVKEHFVLPKYCEATDGQLNGKHEVLINNGNTSDPNLLENFSVKNGTAEANMFAFKFIGTDVVHIFCRVIVCKTDKCITGAYGSGSTGRRRRSALDDGHETYKVSAAFKIVDKKGTNQASGQSYVRVDPTVVLSLLLVTFATTLRNI